MKTNKLLWIDLEMTGLEPSRDRILEVAAIVTDWQLHELAQFEAVVSQPDSVLSAMPAEVRTMHTTSGLLKRLQSDQAIGEDEAERQLLAFMDKHFTGASVVLAGNSIHQDRRFIRQYWPKIEKRLHYRMLDVSAWKLVFMNAYNLTLAKRNAHQALDDIRGSIEELREYLKYVRLDD